MSRAASWGEERDVAGGRLGLEADPPRWLVCSRARELVADVDEAILEVDVAPGEPEQFGEAQAGVEGGGEEGAVAGEAGVEEAADLVVVEHALLAAVDARSFVLFEAAERVVGDVAAAEGVLEDAPERDEGAVDRLGGEPLGRADG